MNLSALSMPTRLLTSETVIGLSPEITFIATLLSLNHLIVEMASSLTLSAMIMSATGVKSFGTASFSMLFNECAKTKTLKP